MSKKTLKLMLVGVCVASASGIIALRAARATPDEGVTRTLIAGPVVLDEIDIHSESLTYGVKIKTKGLSDAFVQHNKIAPGGHSGWHSHPGPVFVLVTAGTATRYDASDPDLTPQVYPAGTGFVEDPGVAHIVGNAGTTDLELVAIFLVPKGEPRRNDEPAPQ